MRIVLRKALAQILDVDSRKALKRMELGLRRRLRELIPSLDQSALRGLLSELGVRSGQVVMLHASLSLVPTKLSAEAVLDILQDLVGPDGTIVVPTYPRMNSADFLTSEAFFDARSTPSGMGALSETLRMRPGATRSTHPTKSVAAIGPHAEFICSGHERCLYPFGEGSPYAKMLDLSVRIIGIGTPLSYLSFVHVPEDLDHESVRQSVWENTVYQKLCYDMSGEAHIVHTMIHSLPMMARADPEKFCRRHMNAAKYSIKRVSFTDFFSVDGPALVSAIRNARENATTIYD